MRRFIKSLLLASSVIFIALVGVWVVLFCTGHSARSYSVLAPDAQVRIGGQELSVAQAAALYQPLLFMEPETSSPRALYCWYEVIQNEAGFTFVYYPTWENEEHPNLLVDLPYKVFRAAYYGVPLLDIEYVQVDVSSLSGAVSRMRFETGASDTYLNLVNEHLMVTVERQVAGGYWMTIQQRSGELVSERAVSPRLIDGRQPCLGVLTWNHLLVLLEEQDTRYTNPVPLGLIYLEEADYMRYQFARRSQGDYAAEAGEGELLNCLQTLYLSPPSALVTAQAQRK